MKSEYNIVLLGESGGGKSLMINSIPVYLQHKTLVDAIQASDILCLIPVSFTVVDDDFKEIPVEFGTKSSNENHKTGESGTVGCISYDFSCDNCLIRLIDTPGVASTQGKERDEVNMEIILESISNYKDIHAIAIVLKSNQTKLTPLLKSCLDQILTHLHSSASPNILFIFTHSESTDYRPGSIMPILRVHFEDMKNRSVSKASIRLHKDNVFCVDNKGFRYLVAKHQGVLNSSEPGISYVTAYSQSANAFGRLLKYIIGGQGIAGLKPHQVANTISINDARQFIKVVTPTLITIINTIVEHNNEIKRSEQRDEHLNKTMDQNKGYHTKQEVLDETSKVNKQWVCTSDKCKKFIVVKENKLDYYPRICSDSSIFPWYIRNKCDKCECKASDHKEMDSITKTKIVEIINKQKLDSYYDAKSEKGIVKKTIKDTEEKKNKAEEESKFIQSAIPTFNKFYLAHAIVLANEDHRDKAQSIDRTKVELEEVTRLKDKLFQLETFGSHIKTEHEQRFNRRQTDTNVRVAKTFHLAQRFPELKF